MKKHSIAIILLLLSLLVARPAEARLTLGVVVGADGAAGQISSAQARSLAALLAERLHEEVEVKELSDSVTLINWLDRFAMIDLALIPAKDVRQNPGRFLPVGLLDKEGGYSLVFRQGTDGDLPKRLARVVGESGFLPWREASGIAPPLKPPAKEPQPFVEPAPPSAEQRAELSADLEHVPPLRQGRTWTPPGEGGGPEVVSADQLKAKKLVLGVVPDHQGVVQSAELAEQFALYLEQAMPVSVQVREFASLETFNEWFLRYRMVDIAVLSASQAKANLGNDYLPIARIFRADSPDVDAGELIVMRHGQNLEMQMPLQRAILDMMQTTEGQALAASLKISEVSPPEDASAQRAFFEREAKPSVEVKKPTVEVVEELLPPPTEYPEPAQPISPPLVSLKVLPELPVLNQPNLVLPELGGREAVLVVPDVVKEQPQPVQPALVDATQVPDMARQAEPLQPVVPQLPEVIVPVIPAEMIPGIEPLAEPLIVETPEIVSPLADQVTSPTEPVSPAMIKETEVPDVELVQSEPVLQEIAPLAEVEAPVVPSESPAVADTLEGAVPPVLKEPEAVDQLPEVEPSETGLVDVEILSEDVETPVVVPVEPVIESELVAEEEPFNYEEQEMLDEASTFADAATISVLADVEPVVNGESAEQWSDEEFAAVLAEDLVAAVVAQPDLPHELRPSGVPVVRPGRTAQTITVAEDKLLVASLPEPLKNVEPPKPPVLLQDPEPEPGIVYVVPFVSIMVPDEVNARVFDQFVDILNQEGEGLGLQFVILKGGLKTVSPEWLSTRKYVTGEIYAYVEDSGCCSTDLRTKAKLTYRQPSQKVPAFGFEYPVKRFFDHDRSSIDVERIKLSDDIAATLSKQLLKALRN